MEPSSVTATIELLVIPLLPHRHFSYLHAKGRVLQAFPRNMGSLWVFLSYIVGTF